MIGQTLGHYRIVEKIGSGGMGEVYRARDERLERDVALKVLPAGTLADEHARKRFRKEALALSKLNHPHIATVYDFDTQEGTDFLVMEYVPSDTLRERLQNGPLPEKEVVRLGTQTAEALEEAHEHGLVHRDLKPGNIALTAKGQAKVLDFGVATLLQPPDEVAATVDTLSVTAQVAGTLPYMAPEQLRGEVVDARSDIHALGAVLYEMATGQRAFPDQKSAQLTAAILQLPPSSPRALNRRVSVELERIVLKCLEKDPENRYQSAKEVVVDLRRLGARSVAAAPVRPRRLARRWRMTLAGAATLMALLVVLVGLNVGGWRERLLGGASPGRIESLAVLPLENLSGDPEQEYFVDGMTEALITDLGKIGALKVISRTSVMQYKGAKKPLPEIARELDVDAVVEGSVLRAGDRVRITAQLIDAATDRNLWAESYERDLRDVLALQREVARAIAREIKVAVTPEEEIHLAGARPVKREAYEAYLRGRYFWNKRTEEALKKSIEYFQQAIEKNPSYAPAYAGLADAYIVMIGWRFISNTEGLPHARAAATKALEIDDTLVEAHASLAGVKEQEWDWIEAELEFRRAIELNPGYATAHQWYAEFLAKMGRFAEAMAEIKRARDLDPFSLIINAIEAQVFFLARRYDEAIEGCQRTLELDPNFFPAHLYLARAYLEMGLYEDAITEMERWAALSGRPEMKITLAFTYAAAGQRTEVRRVLDELERFYVPPYLLALVYVSLGEKDRAFQQLDEAYDVRDPDLLYLKVDPRLDPLRSDPRYQDLLRRMNFPEN